MLRPTIRNQILGIAMGLIVLMAITSVMSTVMARKIAHQLVSIVIRPLDDGTRSGIQEGE